MSQSKKYREVYELYQLCSNGKDLKEFCIETGVNYNKFTEWQRKQLWNEKLGRMEEKQSPVMSPVTLTDIPPQTSVVFNENTEVMYIVYLICTILFILVEYIRLSFAGFENSLISEEILMLVTLIQAISYLFIYRRKQLFCFETLFLMFGLLITFFHIIVLNVTDDAGLVESLFNRYGEAVRIKSLYVSVIGLLFYILGSCRSDSLNKLQKFNAFWQNITTQKHQVNFTALSRILTFFTFCYFVYLYSKGYIDTWFNYNRYVANYTNDGIVNLTILCLSNTVSQFARFAKFRNVGFNKFIVNIDKFYLIIIGLISFLLLVSGNRNEALYIMLPLVICYSIFIKSINNKQFLLLFIFGFLIMVFVGLTRQSGVMKGLDDNLSINLFDFTQDFGYANIDTMYLVEYVDKNGAMGLTNGLITLFSAVPFLGGIMVHLLELEEFTRSAAATTEGMGISYTGLGTSLVGDTYYTGSIVFTIVYFYLIGRLMSYLFYQFNVHKNFNIYKLIIYVFMFSNVIYGLRSEWYISFRYIGFSLLLVFAFSKFVSISKK